MKILQNDLEMIFTKDEMEALEMLLDTYLRTGGITVLTDVMTALERWKIVNKPRQNETQIVFTNDGIMLLNNLLDNLLKYKGLGGVDVTKYILQKISKAMETPGETNAEAE